MFPPDPRIMQEDAKRSRLPLWTWIVVAAGAVAIVLFAVIPGFRLQGYQSAFEQVEPGETVAQVLAQMGPADQNAPPMSDLHAWWGRRATTGKTASDVARVLTWRIHSFGRTVTWQIAFDRAGRAIAKRRYD